MNPPELSRERARRLRREMTDAETRLWSELRGRQLDGVKFRRQVPIGPFIADFCAPERKLVIELDGERHVKLEALDRERARYLETRGYRLIRFWNEEVMDTLDDVLERIRNSL